ncbi:MAG: hypothetical protein SVY10_15110 [Thermodesulfobacteriota bacterium]|nr:hypothetical protein [Thermodesulfobacteriota bacterium]
MSTKHKIISITSVVFIMLLMVFCKVYIGSMSELKKAEIAFEKSEYEEAITHYERSIHWYTPWNRYVKKSIKKLWIIGNEAEDTGNDELALHSYRSLRSSLYAVRSFYTPYPEWIERCDDKISSLMAKKEPYSERDKKKTFEERKADSLKILKRDYAPDVFWSIFLEIGFLGWIGCAIGFIFRVFTGEKGFNGRRALLWGGLIVVFYAMWILGMMRA